MKNNRKNRRQRIAEKAARLKPAEGMAGQARAANDGAHSASQVAGIRAESASPTPEVPGERILNSALDEAFDGRTWFGCRPVLVVIVGLSLAFIAGITYLISQQQ